MRDVRHELASLKEMLKSRAVLPCSSPDNCPFGPKKRNYKCICACAQMGKDLKTGEDVGIVCCALVGVISKYLGIDPHMEE